MAKSAEQKLHSTLDERFWGADAVCVCVCVCGRTSPLRLIAQLRFFYCMEIRDVCVHPVEDGILHEAQPIGDC
jgi:hypothetical protein